MIYYDILTAFYKESVKYLLVGGMSINLYGIPRVTMDLDIIISKEKDNVKKIINILKKNDYIIKQPVDPLIMSDDEQLTKLNREKNLIALSFYKKSNMNRIVDIIVIHEIDFDKAYKNKVIKKAEGTEIYLAPIDDIIKMKRKAGRAQDLSDIKMLKKLQTFTNEKQKNE